MAGQATVDRGGIPVVERQLFRVERPTVRTASTGRVRFNGAKTVRNRGHGEGHTILMSSAAIGEFPYGGRHIRAPCAVASDRVRLRDHASITGVIEGTP